MSRPRLSIIPGEFAADPRADVAHFRVLNLIGRHTSRLGWCKVKQITIAEEVGLTRETVNRKIKDLVDWGYVEKQENDRSGRAIWYRTILDRPGHPGDDDDDDGDGPVRGGSHVGYNPASATEGTRQTHSSGAEPGPVRGGSHVGYNTGSELHPTCDPSDHSRCDRTHAQQERLLNEVKTPLPPQAGEQCGDEFSGSGHQPADNLSVGDDTDEGETGAAANGPADSLSAGAGLALRKLVADRPHDWVIARLLAPLLGKRRFSAADPAAALAQACAKGKGLSPAHLDKALEILLAADVKVVKAERVFAAIDAVRKGGLMLVIARGQPEFAAWLRHYEQTLPNMAALMAREGKWQVPARWPPGQTGQSSEATP